MNKEKLLELYTNFDKVYGPYKRSDGRQHVVLNNTSLTKGEPGKLKTISFPKALYESNHGERLKDNETVDHDDRDYTNNEPSNLIKRDRIEHASLDTLKKFRLEVNCVQCGHTFLPTRFQENLDKAGPFCSRQCSGRYGASVQNGGQIIKKEPIPTIMYRENKNLLDNTDTDL